MLTDPISDYLTRVRNALRAEHPDVEVPASRLKKEVTRILKEQGYISDFAVEPTAVGEVIKIQLRYTDDRKPVITGIERISRPGPPPLRGQDGDPARDGRDGDGDHVDLVGRHDGPRGEGEGRRRRGRRVRLVGWRRSPAATLASRSRSRKS